MKILNYTQHPITILTQQGAIQVLRHGTVRSSVVRTLLEYIDVDGAAIPINKTVFGAVPGLPEENKDTIIIVSAIVANVMRLTGRQDLMVVDEPVREGGKIVGCRALCRITEYMP